MGKDWCRGIRTENKIPPIKRQLIGDDVWYVGYSITEGGVTKISILSANERIMRCFIKRDALLEKLSVQTIHDAMVQRRNTRVSYPIYRISYLKRNKYKWFS